MITNLKAKYYSYSVIFSFLLLIIFCINISIQYEKYKELIYEEIYETNVQVLNIYNKKNYYVLKLKNDNIHFFTSLYNIENIKKQDILNITFITTKISFIDYLKGFYTKTLYFDLINSQNTFKQTLVKKSDSQHHNEMTAELFNALFFAIPVSKELRDICANYGISHLIALSGFHLSVLTFLIYWFLYYPYSFFHKRYYPYRNIKYDLLLITVMCLFFYLILTDVVASLLRAFIMLIIGIFLLRSNIKLFSFLNLFFVFLIIMALFPKYVFSLSLWFSLFGVFYIFLFIQYFKDLKSKVVQVLFFNFWIYFAMNPIVHYFFPTTSYEQLYSPFITLLFTFFYPIQLILHSFNYGFLLDEYILIFLSKNILVFEVYSPLWLFIFYVVLSFISIWNKRAFYVLNILLFGFTLFLYI